MKISAEPPYAATSDLMARWPDMPQGSEPHAKVLLADASALIRASLPAGASVDKRVAVMVVCQMVRRAMTATPLPDGATSISQTQGPFTTSLGFGAGGNSNALYLTRAEKKLLGAGRQRAASIDLLTEPGADNAL